MWRHISFGKGEVAFHGPFAREGSALPGNRESRPNRAVCVHQVKRPRLASRIDAMTSRGIRPTSGHISRKPAGRHDPRALQGEFVRLRRQSTSTPSPAVHLSTFSGRPLFAFPGIPPLSLRRRTTSSSQRKALTQPRRC